MSSGDYADDLSGGGHLDRRFTEDDNQAASNSGPNVFSGGGSGISPVVSVSKVLKCQPNGWQLPPPRERLMCGWALDFPRLPRHRSEQHVGVHPRCLNQ